MTEFVPQAQPPQGFVAAQQPSAVPQQAVPQQVAPQQAVPQQAVPQQVAPQQAPAQGYHPQGYPQQTPPPSVPWLPTQAYPGGPTLPQLSQPAPAAAPKAAVAARAGAQSRFGIHRGPGTVVLALAAGLGAGVLAAGVHSYVSFSFHLTIGGLLFASGPAVAWAMTSVYRKGAVWIAAVAAAIYVVTGAAGVEVLVRAAVSESYPTALTDALSADWVTDLKLYFQDAYSLLWCGLGLAGAVVVGAAGRDKP